MYQIIKIIKWEYINRVKTKLFLITTFLAPLIFALFSILPTWLSTLDPEKTSKIGIVYDEELIDLITRFEMEVENQLRTKNDSSMFIFKKYENESEALSHILDKSIEGYLFISNTILDTGNANYYSLSLSNIKIYSNLKKILNQVVNEKRMLKSGIDISIINLKSSGSLL